ncbi:hypothetical protein [Sporosarcina sp. BP05]|uniref:hypothetical protein n=1 Tax=Sporosarcina sp. BP05 TaxID=2758726 RepID=UPI00164830AD|nr:hypothetical protein [Sporosarcina sp. BP05]
MDQLITEGLTAEQIATRKGINIGIIREYMKLSKQIEKQKQEAMNVREPEYLNCFDELYGAKRRRS